MTAEEPDLPRGIALAWGVAASPQRGPKREMSVERIVDAAVELADAEGLGAVSMAAVAARLGFTPMSLYRYVTAKDDLLLLMQEAATGLPPEEFREPVGWREKLEVLFRAQVQIYVQHPWVLSLPIQGSPATPNSSAWVDAALEALEDTPLSADERIGVMLLVSGQSRFYGMVLAGYAERARSTGLDDAAISAQEAALFDTLVSAEEYPALRRAIDAGVFTSPADPFQFGLDRSLEGVAAYIAALDRGEPAAPPAEWIDTDPAELSADKRYREARKAVREAEKNLRVARKEARLARRDAVERLGRKAR